jgi:hypothetical protein
MASRWSRTTPSGCGPDSPHPTVRVRHARARKTWGTWTWLSSGVGGLVRFLAEDPEVIASGVLRIEDGQRDAMLGGVHVELATMPALL